MVLVNLSFLRVHFLGTLPMFALILLILFEQSKSCCLHIVIKKFEMGKYPSVRTLGKKSSKNQ
jgi:hypothetical protein